MNVLLDLTAEAAALASGRAGIAYPDEEHGEVARQLQICNACRYCEGFCAVFPAMTRRLEFAAGDIAYLANLCHNCSACLYACQYAPPHEFAVALPQAMANVRARNYEHYAWPRALGKLYRHNGSVLVLALVASVFILMALALTGEGGTSPVRTPGDFYAVFSHATMAWMFGAVFALALGAMAVEAWRFWLDLAPGSASRAAVGEAVGNALTLKYLDGGHGEGCNEGNDRFTLARRRLHHLTFYGFMLCFASTCTATIYHYLFGLSAPYSLLSAPVVLGTIGGVSLAAGTCGLLWLSLRRRGEGGSGRAMDRAFIVLLFGTSASGLVLLAGRDTAGMPWLLIAHLAFVMALFLTMPYGKFVHGIYRALSLLKWSIERRQAPTITLRDN